MKYLLTGLIMAIVASGCSNKAEPRGRAKSNGDTTISAAEKAAEDKKQEPYVDPQPEEIRPDGSVPLELLKLAPAGVQFRLASAIGLDQVYSRVFLRRANGNYGAACSVFNPHDCKDSLFTDTEARDLSTLILSRGIQEFKSPSNFTLNYTRSLRAMLLRECRFMVVTELNQVVANPAVNSAKFATVMGEPPADNFDLFLRRLLGVDGLQVTVDADGAAYLSAFRATVAGAPEVERTTRKVIEDAYVATCMAIAMDPRVLVY